MQVAMKLEKNDLKMAARSRADGRRPLLVYLQPELIKQLKKAALDEDRTAYEITEEAVRQHLSTAKKKRSNVG